MSGTRIASGVYRGPYGYEIRWQDAGRTRTKHFPLDTPEARVKDQRATRVKQAHPPQPHGGSFARDALRALKGRKHLPSYKSDRSHLRPWVRVFGALSRWAITKEAIQAHIRTWEQQGYSALTLRHRRRVLRDVYLRLDGEGGPTVGVRVPTPPRRRKRTVSEATIIAVALNLRKQEIVGRLWDMKTRARYLVLVLFGVRPAQLKRALPLDINLLARIWVFQPAKGDRGTVVVMNDEQLAAARLFLAAGAAGYYDGRSFVRTLQRNGWPKGIRPYNARHTVGQALRRSGASLRDIADHFGHVSEDTTGRFYVDPELAQLQAMSERIDGRLGRRADLLLHDTPTVRPERKAKQRQKTPHSADSS